jgi:hypothetical protein
MALSQVNDGRSKIEINVILITTIGVRGGLGASIFVISSGSGPCKHVAHFHKVSG